MQMQLEGINVKNRFTKIKLDCGEGIFIAVKDIDT